MKYSVIIATFNSAQALQETLSNIAGFTTTEEWEVIVVDNNSTDDTKRMISEMAKTFPVELRTVFESEQGKAAALNAGIRTARGQILAFTDDAARFEPDWLDQAGKGLEHFHCDYVGGKVLPIWEGDRPAWLPNRGGTHWAVIALLDYGPEPLEFGKRVPLGINMAIRRDAFTIKGLWWDTNFDRKGNTLRGQGQREWCIRAHANNLRGFYIPEMIVHHFVSQRRMTKNYFRRWMYWKGISRALLYEKLRVDMESPEQTTLDFSKVPHIAGVPRYMFRKSWQQFSRMITSAINGRDSVAPFAHEMWLWFFFGVLRQRWKDRGVKSSAYNKKEI